jgi:hypothetical protein
MSRRFLPYGRGPVFYLVEQVALFDALEFAADRVTYGGDIRPSRWYGVVTVKTEDFLEVEECKSASAAVLMARGKHASKGEYLKALEAEKAHLTARAAEVDAEMQRVVEAPEPEPIETPIAPVRVKTGGYQYAIHYAGRASWKRGQTTVQVSAGFALCVSGMRAERIRLRGNHTLDHDKVTCSLCKEAMQLAKADGFLDPSVPAVAPEAAAS